MTEGGRVRTPSAWLLVVVTAACTVLEAALMVRSGVGLLSRAAFRNAFPVVNVATVVGALVGAVIVSRHPRHRIGWLFCWGQAGVAVGLVMRALADGVTTGGLAASPGVGRLADLLANLFGSQFALVLLAGLLLLAPDGHLPSARWRPFPVLVVVGYALIVVGLLVMFAGGSYPVAEIVVFVGQLGVLVGLVASVVALFVRLRRSTGETRQQLRWILAAAALLAAAPVLAYTLNLTGLVAATPDWVVVILHLGYLGVPLATGLAVLRYRLYDIDRLMGGSVVLAVVAVLVFGGYVTAVGLIGGLLPGGDTSRWLSLLVFVAVVLVFQPIRRSVRRLADRLVYGPQSMSYDALSRFTRELAGSRAGQPFLVGAAEAAGRLVNARRGVAVAVLDDGSQLSATWSPGPDPTGAERPVSDQQLSTPVVSHGVLVGRITVDVPDFAAGSGQRRQLLAALGERLAEGFWHARLEASLRERAHELDEINRDLERSRQRVLAARDIGRRQVSGRIRSDVVDRLSPLGAELAEIADLAVEQPEPAAARVDAALSRTTTAIDALRRITSTVFSRLLAEQGLAEALRSQAGGSAVSLRVIGSPRWSPAVESCLYACCTDLLQGVTGTVVIGLSEPTRGVARVTFASNDLPADPQWVASTRERIEVLGGVVEQQAGQVVLRLPLIEGGTAPDRPPG